MFEARLKTFQANKNKPAGTHQIGEAMAQPPPSAACHFGRHILVKDIICDGEMQQEAVEKA